MNLSRLGICVVVSIVCFLGLYYGISCFLDKNTPDEMLQLFDHSFLYFSLVCIVILCVLELLSNILPEKLAIAFLVLTMMKLGGFILLYMAKDEIPKFIRVLILVPMFFGVILEVLYLIWRIGKINSEIEEGNV